MENGLNKKYDFKGVIRKIGIDKMIIIILCGVAIVVLSVPSEHKEEKNDITQTDNTDILISSDEYSDKLEKKLTDLLNNIKGISDVKVMITLSCGNEAVVLTEVSSQVSEKNDSNKEGENSVQKDYKNDEVVVYEKNSNGETIPYVVKENVPKIEGIAVVAKGAEKTENMIKITNIVQALFDVEVHKISVVGM